MCVARWKGGVIKSEQKRALVATTLEGYNNISVAEGALRVLSELSALSSES
jgi:hypothetical protein